MNKKILIIIGALVAVAIGAAVFSLRQVDQMNSLTQKVKVPQQLKNQRLLMLAMRFMCQCHVLLCLT